MQVNEVSNVKAPLTPVVWLSNDQSVKADRAPVNNLLQWNPIEYIDHYIVLRDGQPVAETTETTFAATVPGEYQVIGVDGNGVESFASQPRSNAPEVQADFPNEKNSISSKEALNRPRNGVAGYRGNGFVETDHALRTVSTEIEIKEPGRYSVSLRYANGNGPVNTENKCAIRTLAVDGKAIGTVVMPQRGTGNWSDWGMSNTLNVSLTEGIHTIVLQFMPENENMNLKVNHALIDRVILRRIGQ